ncbi:DUF1707 SHOCT-like domain-containing protein [Pseudonocardia abyssalis]|uniref:DUF1707 domain-containing protein n=1 Tax=Pseudonocardia abyssalis TaxID=2792008 RepID=A0ABS6ULP9_9PSEU|nr:DUF1707 domain-containing protein [Pseudonocardia abyssalis]MBW0115085.1 DUF1707 domain-containing protein [Pseudonocardia abyssalis]MBW0133180.1 DUF1707 domain-containing protein [Pseudonocardia abyssalis]
METTPPATDTVDGPPTADVRASHADRERVAAVLHAAAGHGQLTLDEVDERLAAAYAARYRGELEILTADLPAGPAADRDPPGWPAVRSAAVMQLHRSLAVAADRHRSVRAVLAHPWIAAVIAVVVLLAMVLLAARLGFDLD